MSETAPTIETDLSFLQDLWRISPDTYAERCSGGRWKPYDYLRYTAGLIRDAIATGGGRIIVSMPPRHGKTELISHWVPTWFLDVWPYKRVILGSYGDQLARANGRKVRNEAVSNRLVRFKIRSDSKAANEFETTEGGGLITAGVGGAITGRGGDLIVIDDPIKTLQDAMSPTIRETQIEWFKHVVYTRLEPGGTILLLLTRWHCHDLAGWLQTEHEDSWRVVNFPAIAEEKDPIRRKIGAALCPDRYDLADLIGEDGNGGIRKAVGPSAWAALYCGRPTPREGSIWKREYWKRWTTLPKRWDALIQSWDPTMKADGSSYCVGQVWGALGSDRYLLDQVRGKWGFSQVIQEFKKLSARWPMALAKLVENSANGPAMQDAMNATVEGIILVEAAGGKEARAMAVEPILESGAVYLPDDSFGFHWVHEFMDEAASFPMAENDDQVDAASQALNYLAQWNQRSVALFAGSTMNQESGQDSDDDGHFTGVMSQQF